MWLCAECAASYVDGFDVKIVRQKDCSEENFACEDCGIMANGKKVWEDEDIERKKQEEDVQRIEREIKETTARAEKAENKAKDYFDETEKLSHTDPRFEDKFESFTNLQCEQEEEARICYDLLKDLHESLRLLKGNSGTHQKKELLFLLFQRRSRKKNLLHLHQLKRQNRDGRERAETGL